MDHPVQKDDTRSDPHPVLWSLVPSVWKVSLTSLEYVSTLAGRSVPQKVPRFISESLFELVRLLEINIRGHT